MEAARAQTRDSTVAEGLVHFVIASLSLGGVARSLDFRKEATHSYKSLQT
jgi:hypothetical protein